MFSKSTLEPGALLAALASAAQVSADYNEEEERKRAEAQKAEEDAEPEPNPHISPEGRLASVHEVNRMLHAALAERKALLLNSEKEVKHLEERLERRPVEEPARKGYIEELQARMAISEPTGKAGREAKLMVRDVLKMEGKISQVNETNLIMSDRHRLDRARMAEQQARLRTLGKRERELAKHLDYLATKLNDTMRSIEIEKDSRRFGRSLSNGSSPPESVHGGVEIDSLPSDFKNLRGMRLSKLVGKKLEPPPPALVLEPGASVPTLALAAEQHGSGSGSGCPANCGFQVTFHESHCCGACKDTNGVQHGPRCEKKEFPEAIECAALCGFRTTFHESHCCGACKNTNGANHGPRCEKKDMSKAVAIAGAARRSTIV